MLKGVRVGEGCKGCLYWKESNNGHKGRCTNPNVKTYFDPKTHHWYCTSKEKAYVVRLRPEFSLNLNTVKNK